MNNLIKMDKKYLARDVHGDPLEIIGSDKYYLIANDGKKYIDFISGWCVGNLGWGNKTIKKRLKQFKGPAYVNPFHLYRPWAELAKLLADITPGKLIKSFRTTGGTESVEIGLRAASAYTARREFMSLEGSYHGDSIATMSIGATLFKKNDKAGLLFNNHKILPTFDADCLSNIENILEKRQVAAFIMEPISMDLGALAPNKSFMQKLAKLCKKYGTLLIMDEVACGFGRTGKMFATEHFGIEPDIMTLGKAITGGYGGLGATITTREIAKAMEYDLSYYSTFGWHPLNVEAALGNIYYFLKFKDKIFNNVNSISQYIKERLLLMKYKVQPEIRVQGLAICLNFPEGNYAEIINKKAFRQGLILSLLRRNTFIMFPPLTINKATTKKALDILESCL